MPPKAAKSIGIERAISTVYTAITGQTKYFTHIYLRDNIIYLKDPWRIFTDVQIHITDPAIKNLFMGLSCHINFENLAAYHKAKVTKRYAEEDDTKITLRDKDSDTNIFVLNKVTSPSSKGVATHPSKTFALTSDHKNEFSKLHERIFFFIDQATLSFTDVSFVHPTFKDTFAYISLSKMLFPKGPKVKDPANYMLTLKYDIEHIEETLYIAKLSFVQDALEYHFITNKFILP